MVNSSLSKLRKMVQQAMGKKPMVLYAQSEIVTILVGPDKTSFKIHKDLLCDSSEYFAAIFNETWNTDKTAETALPEIEPEIFQMIFSWWYTGVVPNGVGTPVQEISDWLSMIRLYRAADFLMMTAIMNSIADMMIIAHGNSERSWGPKTFIKFLQEGLADMPLIYKIAVNSIVLWVMGSQNDEEKLRDNMAEVQKQYPQAMVDVIVQLNTYRTTPMSLFAEDRCIYHVHLDGEKCKKAEDGKTTSKSP